MSPKTLERYDELATRQVAPHLGALKLQKLRPEHVEQWHGPLLKTGLAPRTVGHAHRLLALVLKYAVENGTLARNVAAIRKPPAAEAREVEILTAGQIAESSHQACRTHPIANSRACPCHWHEARRAARGAVGRR